MTQRQEFDDQLNDCLERLIKGDTIADCVGRYPAQREKLVPLLQAAVATMGAADSMYYRTEAKVRSRDRVITEAANSRATGQRAGWSGWPIRLPKAVLAGFVAIMTAGGLTVGTAMASTNSVPGDALYTVKSLKENISLMMPKSDITKAEEHIRLASERTREIGVLVDRGMYGRAEEHEGRIKAHLRQSAYLAGVTLAAHPIEMPLMPVRASLREGLSSIIGRLHTDEAILRANTARYSQSLPPEQSQRVLILMRRSEFNYRTYILVLESDGPPSRLSFMGAGPRHYRRR